MNKGELIHNSSIQHLQDNDGIYSSKGALKSIGEVNITEKRSPTEMVLEKDKDKVARLLENKLNITID